jgi:hypothetical protein
MNAAVTLNSPPRRAAALGLLAAGLLAAGCGSGTSTSQVAVGPIAFTDVNGIPVALPPASLNSGQSAYLDVAVSDDPQNLGASWSVYCGSAPPPGTPPPPGQTQSDACGTFTPAHTMSGPVPSYATGGSGYVTLYTAPAAPPARGTVTLYASSTSNPSRWSSVTLTVDGLPISVGFAPAPPSTLAAGASVQLKAVVDNDPADAGVNWTTVCASSDCGSFHPAQTGSGIDATYTAPASVPEGGTVQIVATSVTDPTKSARATISIAPSTASAGSAFRAP